MAEHQDDASQQKPAPIVPLPADWPGQPLPRMPGDLSHYVPQGLGMAPPLIVLPWDDPLQVLSRPNYYGLDTPDSDPIRAAPSQEPGGGVIYFDDFQPAETIRAVLGVMGVQAARRDFAVFARDAKDTRRERFLTQVRIISKAALAHFFGAGSHAAALHEQPVTMADYVLQFLDRERARWNEPRSAFSERLAGTLGGDGDLAKESLGFGFLVENSYWAVYRLWSRPWLATK